MTGDPARRGGDHFSSVRDRRRQARRSGDSANGRDVSARMASVPSRAAEWCVPSSACCRRPRSRRQSGCLRTGRRSHARLVCRMTIRGTGMIASPEPSICAARSAGIESPVLNGLRKPEGAPGPSTRGDFGRLYVARSPLALRGIFRTSPKLHGPAVACQTLGFADPVRLSD